MIPYIYKRYIKAKKKNKKNLDNQLFQYSSHYFQGKDMTTKIMQQKDILKCKICQNTVQEPKRLNCYHSFCKNCIVTLPRITSKTENGLQCPVCAVFTAENHVKDNLILIELLDMQHNKESDTKHACEQCLEVDSEWKCLDCKIKLCKKCHSNHVRIPLLRWA